MKIEFEERITITIQPTEIEKIIRAALEIQGYVVDYIHFDVRSHLDGYGQDEHEVFDFEGVTASVKRISEENKK